MTVACSLCFPVKLCSVHCLSEAHYGNFGPKDATPSFRMLPLLALVKLPEVRGTEFMFNIKHCLTIEVWNHILAVVMHDCASGVGSDSFMFLREKHQRTSCILFKKLFWLPYLNLQ